ncbi:ABC transporter ATP-binding protein [Candidatus Methylomirabilis sp.]|uniref:ABC transporter ATP-binding protein n=1 Tax=Candidatus Methylomirabilis tolerans TaxID=3123416 RepID=A0AAJ1EIJ5_9BACT|nr:ABC transporter ATP-binding protein [Candidatus Methylomirabilis sp.]
MSGPILCLERVKVTYDGILVLNAPSFEIQEGQILAVIGPNGAGKSTLLRLLGLLEGPTEGRVLFRGQAVQSYGNLLAVRRRMASVFQEPLLTDGTVEANVALGLRLRRIDSAEVNRRVQEGMTTLGIGHLATRRTRTLSGGEAQRVSLARALVLDPEVFLLDEPFAAMDPPTREGLLVDLKAILDKRRITTIFVTHDRNEALALGNQVAVMIGGRVLQVDAPERVFAEPINEEVARFVGIETILRGHVQSVSHGLATVEVAGWALEVAVPLTPGECVLVCLRPEEITLFPRGAILTTSSARNQLCGRVIRHLPAGSTYRVTIDCGVLIVATVTRQSWEQLGLHDGAEVVAAFKATAPHIIHCA